MRDGVTGRASNESLVGIWRATALQQALAAVSSDLR